MIRHSQRYTGAGWGLCFAVALLSSGCHRGTRRHAAPAFDAQRLYQRAEQCLDPSVEAHWPKAWTSGEAAGQQFAAFVRFAAKDPQWRVIGLKGEALLVRCAAAPEKIELFPGSNQISHLAAGGGVEILSLRRYTRCERVVFDASEEKLGVYGPSVDRKNPLFGELNENAGKRP